jgi:hypothetical protein
MIYCVLLAIFGVLYAEKSVKMIMFARDFREIPELLYLNQHPYQMKNYLLAAVLLLAGSTYAQKPAIPRDAAIE